MRRQRVGCSYRDMVWMGQTFENTCNMEFDVKIVTINSERIEGRFLRPEKGNNFNCKKCKFDKPLTQWQDFAWIPE